VGKHLIESMPVWVTTLGRGAARAGAAKRAAARAAKQEANRKLRDIGSPRRVGCLIRLVRYGDDILAEFEVTGVDRAIDLSAIARDEAAAMLKWMREVSTHGQ
jgi:hypothetical protein